MYILSIEEMLESITQIIHTVEDNESLYGIVVELAHQLRDELSVVCTG